MTRSGRIVIAALLALAGAACDRFPGRAEQREFPQADRPVSAPGSVCSETRPPRNTWHHELSAINDHRRSV